MKKPGERVYFEDLEVGDVAKAPNGYCYQVDYIDTPCLKTTCLGSPDGFLVKTPGSSEVCISANSLVEYEYSLFKKREGTTMATITLTVPQELRTLMDEHKADFNFSKIFQVAVREKIDMAEENEARIAELQRDLKEENDILEMAKRSAARIKSQIETLKGV